MEIHSSSLAFIPAGNNAAKKHDKTLQSITNDNVESQKNLTLPSPKETEQRFNAKNFHQLSEDIEKQQNRPANFRTARALDAYTQQNIQPLKNQRSELITGIDILA
jgi:hypothetical protein